MMKEKPKFSSIEDYWDKHTTKEIFDLLKEYEDLFPSSVAELKGIKGEMGEIKIVLKPNVRPVKHHIYQLNARVKEKVMLVVFSTIVTVAFLDYIHKFLEAYMDDWTVCSLLKRQYNLLKVMFDHYRKLKFSLNLKKCIFVVHFGTLLGNIVCKEGVCVDPVKFAVIFNMPPPTSVKKLRLTLGHIGYYRRFINNYSLDR